MTNATRFPAIIDDMTKIVCSAVLFDMDGVLIDSTPAVARVWHGWAVERGFDPQEVVKRAHGRPSLATVRELLPHADHEAENREVERREMEDLQGVVLLPGARALLESLPRGRWTIVTSSTRPLAEVRLRAVGLPVPEAMITSSDVSHGKPHPQPFQNAAIALGVAAERCVVVEDAPAGVRAGKSAGARVIALTTITDAATLTSAGADWVVASCSDISVGGIGRWDGDQDLLTTKGTNEHESRPEGELQLTLEVLSGRERSGKLQPKP